MSSLVHRKKHGSAEDGDPMAEKKRQEAEEQKRELALLYPLTSRKDYPIPQLQEALMGSC